MSATSGFRFFGLTLGFCLLFSFQSAAQSSHVKNILSSTQWDSLFPKRAGTYGTHPQGYTSDFYSYNHLVKAVEEMSDYFVLIRTKKGVWGQLITVTRKSTLKTYVYSDVESWWYSNTTPENIVLVDFGDFLNEASSSNNRRELAAFLANISKETTGGWQLPVGGGSPGDYASWGLYFVHEVGYNKSNGAGTYSQPHAEFPPNSKVGYYGRGPIQLSWNYNYGQFSKFIYNDKNVLLDYPDSIQENGVLAFKSALWFWMMPQCPKPSCHQVMHDQWLHDSAYTAAKMYSKGFAHTNNIINGGLECRSGSSSAFTDKVKLRSDLYKYYLGILGFDSRQIAREDSGDYSTLCYASSSNAMTDYLDCRINKAYYGSFAVDTQTSCGSYKWLDGKTYTESTNTAFYKVPKGDRNGNDSLLRLHLSILPQTERHDTQTACGAFTWIDSLTYTRSTDSALYVLKGKAANGCDSIIRLHLTLLPASEKTDTQFSCGPFRWMDGNTYSTSNDSAVFIMKGAAANGCDSLIRLHLIIPPASEYIDTQSSCGPFRWIDGNTYTASNDSAVFVLKGAASNGCDSLIRLHLSVLSATEYLDTQISCGPFKWVDGNTYSTSNDSAVYVMKGAAVNGCDSLIRLRLTVLAPATGVDVHNACNAFTWIDGKTYTADNNSAEYVIRAGAANGCDSTVRLQLRIDEADAGIVRDDTSISAISEEGTYQWGNCENGFTPIAGAQQRTLLVKQNGSYALELSINGCKDTSECVTFDQINSIQDTKKPLSRIYPNPVSDIINIEHPTNILEVEWINGLGQCISRSSHNNPQLQLNCTDLKPDTYTLKLYDESGAWVFKVVVMK